MNAAHNDWQTRYGKKRRAIDKAILAECERSIPDTLNPTTHSTTTAESFVDHRLVDRDDASRCIALAFGRPLT